MGTTLSGLKIKDTYQGLIKLSDNAAASSSTKELTDGVGNDLNIQVDTTGRLEATKFVVTSGTSSQILLADGTVGTTLGTSFLADDSVTFAKLEDRYSELSPLGSGTSFALNFLNGCTFTATASGAATFTFSNAVQGQVVDLILGVGNYAITFAETGSTFNRVGSTTYDGSSTNLIQIVCTDDTPGSKIYHYSIATYSSAQPQ
jgi:hypothetical protein